MRRIFVALHVRIGLTADVGIVTVGDFVGAVNEVRLVKDHETLREGRGQSDIELDLDHAAGRNAQVADVKDIRVGQVPDSNFRSTDRMFNVAGKQANRGAQGEDAGSNYGAGAVAVETQIAAPKVPASNDNINMMEVVHNGVESYTNATGEPLE